MVAVLVGCGFLATPALANDERPWTLSAGYGQVVSQEQTDADGAQSVFIGIERRFGATSIGLSGGASRRDFALPDAVTITNASSYSLGGSIAQTVGDAAFALSVDHARETGDVAVSLPSSAVIPATARNRYWSVSGSIAQVFGDRLRVTPAASGGWSRASSAIDAMGPAASFTIERDDSGLSATAGATLAADLGERVTLFAGGYGVYADNAASVFQVTTPGGPRRGNAGARTLQSFGASGSDAWGEVTAGASLSFDRVTFGIDAVASVGLDQDFIAVNASTSVSF